ncbi:DNA circularization N-terminal domain-containing protein [Roseomonas xinghualingensis]|uniref:DNA circularization N-terminal domain-containing protein n=1 Tax=Roseomonas xinghualingensis TaxID=2986475 RepID=UPI0021F1C311|nr:DNA circularization N-terminal domain-containing protein [Roseomonas sp. SXEYE001]MCV4207574.1 DNA circularization N-terminal domain-containing protein [Roseomonas sp. SXEYE001]
MSGSYPRWRDHLRPAFWRDVHFKVIGSEGLAGRRVHLHEYPFRDEPWAEDLGRRTRSFTVRGYLIGDDVDQQLLDIEAAAEQPGSGTLVHPLRGEMEVTLLALGWSDAWDEGRVVRLIMEFVETGARRFPTSIMDGAAEIEGAAAHLEGVAGEAGERGILDTLKEGYEGAQRIVKTARSYAATARQAVSSATRVIRSVSSIASAAGLGNVGRFINKATRGVNRDLGMASSFTGRVSSILGRVNSTRNTVTRLGNNVTSLAERL